MLQKTWSGLNHRKNKQQLDGNMEQLSKFNTHHMLDIIHPEKKETTLKGTLPQLNKTCPKWFHHPPF